MNQLSMHVLAAAVASAIPAAQADIVTQWNQTAEAVTNTLGAPPVRNRAMAMTQGAVHDALNTIDARYELYLPLPAAAAGASPEAAVAAASHRVLQQLAPAQGAMLDAAYAASLAALPPCPPSHPACVADGIAAGLAAAEAMIVSRNGDGSATPHRPYAVPPGPGVYQITPPQNATPLFGGWGAVTPFVVNASTQFLNDPPPMFDLASEAYTRNFNEVKRVGDMGAELRGDRTPEQSAGARFWPPLGWNTVARQLLLTRDQGPWGNARLLALMNMALHDAAVTLFETKYVYNFWRPVTAIRAADIDGNPDTAPDPGWVSYQVTPPYPDYTSGLTALAGSAAEVLRRYFGTDELPFSLTLAGVTRGFATLTEATDDAIDARVFGGMHFRDACVDAVRQGRHIGHFVYRHALREARGRR